MITVNGVALSTYGFTYSDRRIPRLPGARVMATALPGGEARVIGRIRSAPPLQVIGQLNQGTHANLLTALDSLVAAVRGPGRIIRFADITDREWVGELVDSSSADAVGPAEITTSERIVLAFTVEQYARAQSVTEQTGANPTLTLGTAPSLLNVDVQNGAGSAITQIVVAVRAGTTVLRSLTWVGSVASSGLWRLTMDPAWEVTNAAANAIDGLAETSEWPEADPHEGATNLLVTITGGSSPVVTTRYRRRWQ